MPTTTTPKKSVITKSNRLKNHMSKTKEASKPLPKVVAITLPEVTLKKRGRAPGSTSFAYVSLAHLNTILKPDAMVQVAKKYAEMVKLEEVPLENVSIPGVETLTPKIETFENEATENKATENEVVENDADASASSQQE